MILRRSTMGWLGLPLLAGLAFASALHNPFVYDDSVAIQENSLIRQLHLTWLFFHGGLSSSGFAHGQFRPLTLLSFSLNYLVGGENPFGYRLVNLVLHASNAVLGGKLLQQLLLRVPWPHAGPPLTEPSATAVALLAAALFVVHPVDSLSVLLVWKRATLLVTLFSLLAVLSLLWLRREEARPRPLRRVALCAGLWGSQLLALGAKETAAILPALLLLVDLWPRAGWNPRQAWRAVLRLQWPTLLIGVAGAIFLLTRAAQVVPMGRWVYCATEAKVIWGYLAMVMVPSLVSIVYDVAPARVGDGYVWLASLSLLGVLVFAVAMIRRRPWLALAILWAALALAPTSTLVPIPLLMDEDRVYLALLLLWVFPAYLLVWWAGRGHAWFGKPAARVVGAVLLLVLVGFTLARASLWCDPVVLWSEANERHPDSAIAATNFCAALTAQPERAQQAVAICQKAYERAPDDPNLQFNLTKAYVGVGAMTQAESLVAALLARGQTSPQLLRVAGHLAWYRDRPADAIGYYRQALADLPLDLETAIYLARSYAELQQTTEATSLARQIDHWVLPGDVALHLALAALHQSIGWSDRACAEYRKLAPQLATLPIANADGRALDAACAALGRRPGPLGIGE